ncbi:orotidine-5'-phosphate decarboxylase [Paucilactobacillus suebicus]|uniref:Orotidine 5'-phosphate decarboxylase n=1 Tax=Paucilactobacillus suebicus DSM 5007 = KCTC 3549 TaxID=1423807 RepID=A0A0R1W2U6_9LACO|nr:orotidine-5'-phosphate decarboxylase [Paucilactobacillus suebicus]KRM09865.1 orotidine-5-phosphate decarboxylase [Paucilactobacillus suebicus DSM 5007 = KCTC 3549]
MGGSILKRFVPFVALDVASEHQAEELLDQLAVAEKPIIKIGMELFYSFGPSIVKMVQDRGFDVFLDLKLHDIPNTVKRAMTAIGKMGVSFTTIHAAGGNEMLKAGREGLDEGAQAAGVKSAKLLAITQLTSIDETILHEQQHVDISLIESVQSYAQLAQNTGMDGVICSAQELSAIRRVTDDGFLCITPGIRPTIKHDDDQKRVVTPAQARELGSNGIVVGRPITRSDNPVQAYLDIKQAFMEE